ncbi:hypothetical protein [Halosegnis longus]
MPLAPVVGQPLTLLVVEVGKADDGELGVVDEPLCTPRAETALVVVHERR